MNRSLCLLAGLLGLAACHSQTSQTTATVLTTSERAPTPPALTSSPGTSYRVFRGLRPLLREGLPLPGSSPVAAR